MQAASAILKSLLQDEPHQTAMSVFRHAKATLNAMHDKTLEPHVLIREILPYVPESTQKILTIYLDNEELFFHLWDELEVEMNKKCMCI